MNETLEESLVFQETLAISLGGPPFFYGSVPGSIRFWSNRLDGQLWLIASDVEQIQALTTATTMIDGLRYVGSRFDSEQLGEFPRANGIVPVAIQNATYELAMALLKKVDLETEYNSTFVTKDKFGQLETNYDYGIRTPEHIVAGIPSLAAWKLLSPFLTDPRAIRTRRG